MLQLMAIRMTCLIGIHEEDWVLEFGERKENCKKGSLFTDLFQVDLTSVMIESKSVHIHHFSTRCLKNQPKRYDLKRHFVSLKLSFNCCIKTLLCSST